MSFGLGVATLPLPFLKIRSWIDIVILVIGLVLIAGVGLAADNGIDLPTDLPSGSPLGLMLITEIDPRKTHNNR